MIDEPSVCPCGNKFFPTPTRRDVCRECAKRIEVEGLNRLNGEDIIDDESEGIPRYLPTYEEIETMKAEIRRGWDKETRRMARMGICRDD